MAASSSSRVDGLARPRRSGRGRGAAPARRCDIWSRRTSSTTARMRSRADARSPRQASSQARVRSRVATDVATGLSPTWSARRRRGRRRAALAEQQVALGDADVGPHQRRVLAGRAGRVGDAAEPADRLVAATGVAGDLGERHLEPHPGAHRVRRPAPARRPARAARVPRVAAGVGERVGLVDEVLGDAAPGQPAGQLGVVGRGLAGELGRLVVAADVSRLTDRAAASSTRVEPRGRARRSTSAIRSASAGRPAPASSVARRASTAAIAAGSVSRSRAVSCAASAPSRSRRRRSGCRRAGGRGGPAGRRSSGSSHTAATTRSTSSSRP